MSTLTLPLVFPISESHHDANFTLTSPSKSIYVLTLNSPPENRLTPSVLRTFMEALDFVASNVAHSSVLITTSAIPKFYSNGFNLDIAKRTEGFIPLLWNQLQIKLLTFPMPTVALMNGHAYAAGLMTAMAHDYRVMNPSKGWCCMNEIHFGGEVSPSMSSIFRQKVTPLVYRTIILEGKRFTGPEALEAGIVDATGGMQETMQLIESKKLVGKGGTGVWGVLRDEMYRETIALLQRYGNGGSQRVDNRNRGLPHWSKL